MKSRGYGDLQKAADGSALYYLLRDPHENREEEAPGGDPRRGGNQRLDWSLVGNHTRMCGTVPKL